MWDEAEHLPAVNPAVGAREDPQGAIAPVCPFYGGSKLWTGAAICFCPALNFIYSPTLAVKPTIYDFLFN